MSDNSDRKLSEICEHVNDEFMGSVIVSYRIRNGVYFLNVGLAVLYVANDFHFNKVSLSFD